jgi:NADPH:quinone reductase-like Zn-dependent oxidoreductase
MKSIVLPDYNPNLIRALRSLRIEDLELPELKPDQVLVKVNLAPCNPSDIAFLRGMYNIKRQPPIVPGFEAAGEVVSAGVMREARDLLGNKVSCFIQDDSLPGTWSEYFITHWEDCIEIRSDISMEQAATLCVNPFTAYALLELVKKMESPAFIQDAASGQVGMFLRNMAKKNNIRVINIVRKPEHLDQLLQEGEKYVLNQNDEDFEQQLRTMAHELNASIALDAVGGDTSGTIFNAMPPESNLVLYGGLSGQRLCNAETMDLIFSSKTISGFNLGDWKARIGQERFLEIALELQEMIMDGIIETKFQGTFKPEDMQAGLSQYIRNMSGGKILFEF